ncbi:MAG: hypothetical protein ACXIUD_10990 [Mongoliitalea sp.]
MNRTLMTQIEQIYTEEWNADNADWADLHGFFIFIFADSKNVGF